MPAHMQARYNWGFDTHFCVNTHCSLCFYCTACPPHFNSATIIPAKMSPHPAIAHPPSTSPAKVTPDIAAKTGSMANRMATRVADVYRWHHVCAQKAKAVDSPMDTARANSTFGSDSACPSKPVESCGSKISEHPPDKIPTVVSCTVTSGSVS